MNFDIGRACFDIQEVIAATGLSKATIFRMIAAGKLQTRKVGRKTVVLSGELNRFLNDLPIGETPTMQAMRSAH